MRRALIILSMLVVATGSRPAFAEEVCKAVELKNPAVTLSEIFEMAQGHARAWQADAVPAQIGNTSLGPLQPDGSSVAWNLTFYSERARASVAINTFRGTYRCWAQSGTAGRIPDLRPDFFRDGLKLHALAREHGAALIDQGYTVMVQTAAAPRTRHATWYINYRGQDGTSGGVTVIIDANTGAVQRVLQH